MCSASISSRREIDHKEVVRSLNPFAPDSPFIYFYCSPLLLGGGQLPAIELRAVSAREIDVRSHWSPARARAHSSSPLPPSIRFGVADRRAPHAKDDNCRDRRLWRAHRSKPAPVGGPLPSRRLPRGSATRWETAACVRACRRVEQSVASQYLQPVLPYNARPRSPLA